MYIHPDGTTTGSVNHAVLDAYNQAKADGADLSEFAPYLAENSPEAKAAAGYPGPQPSPDAVAADKRAAAQAQAVQESSNQRAADLAAQFSQQSPAQKPGGQQAAPEPAADDYEGQTKEDLQSQLRDLGLPTSGNKDELVARLRDAEGR